MGNGTAGDLARQATNVFGAVFQAGATFAAWNTGRRRRGPTLARRADVGTDPGGVRLRIGVALQEAALDAKQTGAEILRFQGRLYGLTGAEVDRRLKDLRA